MKLIELLGEDGALKLVAEFPNVKLPGKKFCQRILRSKLAKPQVGDAGLKFMLEYGDLYRTQFKRAPNAKVGQSRGIARASGPRDGLKEKIGR